MEQQGARIRDEVGSSPSDPSGAEQHISAIDSATIHNLRALQQPGEADLLSRVVELYIADAASLKERIAKGIELADADSVRESAHSLRSSSENVGASRVAAVCRDLEELAGSGSLQDAALFFAQLDGELGHALAELVELTKAAD